MKWWKTSGTGLKHDFMNCKMARAGADPEENRVARSLQVELAGRWAFLCPSGPHLMASRDDRGSWEEPGWGGRAGGKQWVMKSNSSSPLPWSWSFSKEVWFHKAAASGTFLTHILRKKDHQESKGCQCVIVHRPEGGNPPVFLVGG